jgi:hypothetical protein
MSGDTDPLYRAARSVLLDALEALHDHRSSIVLVGAQAIYVHAGEADIAMPAFTSDGDLALDPRDLGREPALEAAMKARGFALRANQVGIWECARSVDATVVTIDLLVPDSLGGPGARGARLEGHDYKAARKVRGLEGCLIDRAQLPIASLDAADSRVFNVWVAGPAALIVTKCFKLAERIDESPRRVKPKDAYDVLRLLRGITMDRLVAGFRSMAADEMAQQSASVGAQHLRSLFSRPGLRGSELAAEAAAGFEDSSTVRQSCSALATELLSRLP